MSIYTIPYDDGMDKLWDLLVWEGARLLKDENAKDLAPEADEHLERWDTVAAGQRKMWRAEIVAQAGVDALNDDTDDTTDDIDNELQRVERDRRSPRYKRYFKKAPNEVIRLGLESQLEVVRQWPDALKTEPEKPLKKLGERLAENIKDGDEAVEARAKAIGNTANHRVREIIRLIDDINAARRTRYGVLIQRAEELKLPRDWPQRFFKKSTQGPKRAKAEPKGGETKGSGPETPA